MPLWSSRVNVQQRVLYIALVLGSYGYELRATRKQSLPIVRYPGLRLWAVGNDPLFLGERYSRPY